jgi:hypothetical protein
MIIIRVNAREAAKNSATAGVTTGNDNTGFKIRVPAGQDATFSSHPLSTFQSQTDNFELSTSKRNIIEVNVAREVDLSVDRVEDHSAYSIEKQGPNASGGWNEV